LKGERILYKVEPELVEEKVGFGGGTHSGLYRRSRGGGGVAEKCGGVLGLD